MQGPYATGRLVTIFGGSGFIGRYAVRALVRRGWRIRVAVRRPGLAGFLQPLGVVGQIHAVQANLRYPDSIAAALDGADAAVNLVGLVERRGRQTLDALHRDAAGAVAAAAASAGIAPFVHVSSLGADPASKTPYFRTKGEGEAAVRAAYPGAIILRPCLPFGPEDKLINRLARLVRLAPLMPLPGASTRIQPAYVGDVGEAIARAVDGQLEPGKVYELGGPEVVTVRGLAEEVARLSERRRLFVRVPMWLGTATAAVLQLLPGRLLTTAEIDQLRRDNVVSAGAIAEGRTLEGIGIAPTTLEAVIPTYLVRYRARGQFEQRRGL